MFISAASNMMNRFTSKERDAETGLDYFGARYYSGAQGRFTSPDPLLGSTRVADPQSWNRYSYVLNNPMRFTDPFGLFVWAESAGGSNSDADLANIMNDETLDPTVRELARRQREFRTRFRSILQGDPWLAAVMGPENSYNGISVAFDQLPSNVWANHDGGIQSLYGIFFALVRITFNRDDSEDELGIGANHEASHGLDYQEYADAINFHLPWANILRQKTFLNTEIGAYQHSVDAAKKLRRPWQNYVLQDKGVSYEIWKANAESIDRDKLEQFLRARYGDEKVDEKLFK